MEGSTLYVVLILSRMTFIVCHAKGLVISYGEGGYIKEWGKYTFNKKGLENVLIMLQGGIYKVLR